MLLRSGPVFAFDDVVSLVPNLINIAFLHQIGLEHVVCAPDGLRTLLALFNGENRGQRFVFDGYGGYSFGEKVAVGMGQQQNRFFWMVNDLVRQAGLIIGDQRDAILSADIFRRHDYKFVPRNARPEPDVPDFPPRNLAADRRAVEHPWQGHVVDVLRLPGDLLAAFLARHRCADDLFIGGLFMTDGIVHDAIIMIHTNVDTCLTTQSSEL